MNATKGVVSGFRGNSNSCFDRSCVKTITCISAVIIFGCLAAICISKGGVSSLANRKVCYIGFASSGVALAFAFAALILGCRKGAKESQKVSARTSTSLESQGRASLPHQTATPMQPAAQLAGRTSPPGELIPAQGDESCRAAELNRRLLSNFSFARATQEEGLEMARHIASRDHDYASIVPLNMLANIELSDEFIRAYLKATPQVVLYHVPEKSRQAFVRIIIHERNDLVPLIYDPELIRETTPAFIKHYLEHWVQTFPRRNLLERITDKKVKSQFVIEIINGKDKLFKKASFMNFLEPQFFPEEITCSKKFMDAYLESQNKRFFLETLPQTVFRQFQDYIIADKQSYFFRLPLSCLTEGLLTDPIMDQYLSRQVYLNLDGRNQSDDQLKVMIKLANFIVEKKSDKASFIYDLSLIKVVPSADAIARCLSSFNFRSVRPNFMEMEVDVRNAFISHIHKNKMWKTPIGSLDSKIYEDTIDDSSWISHLPEDDKCLKSLRERLNTSNTK